MSGFKDITPTELALVAVLLGIAFTEDKSPEEQNTLGNFIVAIGCTILAIAAQAQYRSSLKEEDQSKKETDDMKKQIKELQAKMNELLKHNSIDTKPE